jgi:hypothetical protein
MKQMLMSKWVQKMGLCTNIHYFRGSMELLANKVRKVRDVFNAITI